MLPDNIIIGKPLVDLEKLGVLPSEETVFENDEIFIPRIMKKYGFADSTGEVKRNKPDLWKEVSFPGFKTISYGHKRVCIISGEK